MSRHRPDARKHHNGLASGAIRFSSEHHLTSHFVMPGGAKCHLPHTCTNCINSAVENVLKPHRRLVTANDATKVIELRFQSLKVDIFVCIMQLCILRNSYPHVNTKLMVTAERNTPTVLHQSLPHVGSMRVDSDCFVFLCFCIFAQKVITGVGRGSAEGLLVPKPDRAIYTLRVTGFTSVLIKKIRRLTVHSEKSAEVITVRQ